MYFLKAIFLLSDEIILIFNKNLFCKIYNARSFVMRWNTRFYYDKGINKYIATSGDFKQHFLNRSHALRAYRISLNRRSNYMKSVYQIDKINFGEGDVVVDCGANVGDLHLLIRIEKYPVNYIAFEPSPSEFSCLELNSSPSKIFNEGLWNAKSHLDFYVSSDGADSSFIAPKKFDEIIKINTSRLDQKIPRNLKIKLLKIEAEGAEPEALEGAENILHNVMYITADLGFERGIDQESTICPVVNFLLNRNFELIGLTNGRLVALFKNKKYNDALGS
jgi:FkbM family methyltransferase